MLRSAGVSFCTLVASFLGSLDNVHAQNTCATPFEIANLGVGGVGVSGVSQIEIAGAPSVGTGNALGVTSTAPKTFGVLGSSLELHRSPEPCFGGFAVGAGPYWSIGFTAHASGSAFDVLPPTLIPDALSGLTISAQFIVADPAGFEGGAITDCIALTLGIAPPAGFVSMAPGTFEMGSSAPEGLPYFGLVGPVHTVTISQPFWMGQTEVTRAQFLALMGFNPSSGYGSNKPVERTSWHDAGAYCTALTAAEMLAGRVPVGYEYRLPTEAEWEYACRAGTTTEFNTGVDLLCSDAWFKATFHPDSMLVSCGIPVGTNPVGGFAPNAWGLYDMHGNVWE